MKRITWTFLSFFLILLPLQAQDDQLAPVTGTVAVTNVNIVPSPGQLIEKGTVLVRNGLITEVGKNVNIPAGARIIKADSMYLYSGFILGMSNVGIKMPEQKKDTPEVKDPGNPPNDLAGITPERSVNDFLDPSHKSINDWRELGFTVAQTAPSGGMLPGTASVILLKGENNQVGDFILKPQTALYATFDGARRMYPSTIIGVMAKFRELYRQAEQAKDLGQIYLNDPTGRERPKYNKTLEAFYAVVNKQASVIFHAEEVLPAQRAMLLQKDLGFNLVLTDLKEGWDLMSNIKSSGSPVLFSLDLPEWKEEKKDSVKVEEEKTSAEKERLKSRKEEFKKKYYGQMAQFAAAGVPFGFSGLEGKTAEVQKNLRLIVENGLSEKDALAALTTTPAALLGVTQMAGTVEKGKMANLVISTKPYFEKDSKVRYVMVEGRVFDYELKEAGKADPSSIAMAVGSWSYRTDTPDGPITGTLTLKNDDGVLSGTITNSLTGGESKIDDIILTKDNLSFNFDVVAEGEVMNIHAVLTLTEDSFDGNFSGEGNEYSVKGTKNPKT